MAVEDIRTSRPFAHVEGGRERVGVGDADTVDVREREGEADEPGELVKLTEEDADPLTDCVFDEPIDTYCDCDGDAVGETVVSCVAVAVMLGDGVEVRETVLVCVGVAVALGEDDSVCDGVSVTDAVLDAVCDAVEVTVCDAVEVSVCVGVSIWVAVCDDVDA